MIEEAPMNYLCKVIQTTAVNGFEVFFGEIVATFVSKSCLTNGKPDAAKINPTMLMGFGYYSLGELLGRPFQVPAIAQEFAK
jgi:flavin reductase (DIM6/NTAB) family NADH-FMN oxidoreductase RutF